MPATASNPFSVASQEKAVTPGNRHTASAPSTAAARAQSSRLRRVRNTRGASPPIAAAFHPASVIEVKR